MICVLNVGGTPQRRHLDHEASDRQGGVPGVWGAAVWTAFPRPSAACGNTGEMVPGCRSGRCHAPALGLPAPWDAASQLGSQARRSLGGTIRADAAKKLHLPRDFPGSGS